jgi:hypothetical protein
MISIFGSMVSGMSGTFLLQEKKHKRKSAVIKGFIK